MSCSLFLCVKVAIGQTELAGYSRYDFGSEEFSPDSVDEIYASHVLQYASHLELRCIIERWISYLKPNGELWLAVPDIHKIPIDSPCWLNHLFGNQGTAEEYYRCTFSQSSLMTLMAEAGLVQISPWTSQNPDASQLPWSLNLMGVKPNGTSAP